MHAAIVNYTLQPGKKTEFLSWYESNLSQWRKAPGLITQYVVELDDEDTIMSFGVFESEAAATAGPPAELLEVLGEFAQFLAEGGASERRVYPILTQLR